MTEHPRSDASAGVERAPEVAARTETYLEAGRRGKNTWWRYLLGVVFIVLMWFIVGGWASAALGNALGVPPGQIATNPSAAGPIVGYLIISASFPEFLLGTLIAVTFLHRRSPLTLVTSPAYSLIQFVAVAAIFYVAVFVPFKRPTKKGR